MGIISVIQSPNVKIHKYFGGPIFNEKDQEVYSVACVERCSKLSLRQDQAKCQIGKKKISQFVIKKIKRPFGLQIPITEQLAE